MRTSGSGHFIPHVVFTHLISFGMKECAKVLRVEFVSNTSARLCARARISSCTMSTTSVGDLCVA